MLRRAGGRVNWPKLAVVALSLLAGSAWVLTQGFPSSLSYPLAAFIHFTNIGLSGGAVWACTGRGAISWRVGAMLVVCGVTLFALPGLVVQAAQGAVPELASVVLFCSIPLTTALLMMVTGDEARGTDGRLAASALGLGGALLLLSFDSPRSPRGWGYLVLLAAASVLVAAAGIGLRKAMHRSPIGAAAGLVGLACAAVFGGVVLSSGKPELSLHDLAFDCLRCIAFDLPLVWTTLWLSRKVEPDRFATRFLLAPLFTAVEGFLGMGGGVGLRNLVAMGMMAAGAAWMLFHRDSEEVTALHLR